MAKFITVPTGTRINIDAIESYENDKTNPNITNIYTRDENCRYTVEIPVEEIDRLIAEADRSSSILSPEDKTVINSLSRHMEDLKNAIGRMPASVRMHY